MMNKDKALKLALEALEYRGASTWLKHGIAVEAIKEALAQPAQEPVAWMTINGYGEEDDIHYENPEGHLLEGWTYKPLYTTPPQRPWVGLTQEEREEIESRPFSQNDWLWFYTCAIEAKLKEKNNAA